MLNDIRYALRTIARMPGFAFTGAANASGDFVAALGSAPLAGRTGSDEVPNGAPAIVLSCRLWRRRFGGSSDVIGRTTVAEGQARTVVGVMRVDPTIALRME